MFLKKVFKRIVYHHKASSEDYISWLRKKGVRIGDGTSFICPKTTLIDVTRPWMVEIGKSCCITGGVTVLSHDYGWAVTKAVFGDVIGSCGKVTIGNNVYIGMHTTVVSGVTIGDNVIIGANSLVSRDIPSNVVAAGNPARVIRTLHDYYDKRKRSEIEEAVAMVREYYEVYKSVPPLDIMREHFWIFENKKSRLIDKFIDVNNLVHDSEEKTWYEFAKHKPQFESYEDFLKYCGLFDK